MNVTTTYLHNLHNILIGLLSSDSHTNTIISEIRENMRTFVEMYSSFTRILVCILISVLSIIIEQISNVSDNNSLLTKEAYWSAQPCTLQPFGFKQQCNTARCYLNLRKYYQKLSLSDNSLSSVDFFSVTYFY